MTDSLPALSQTVTLSDRIQWGTGRSWILMAGPDSYESKDMLDEVAAELKSICDDLKIPWLLKCSFDKANRQSLGSFRGVGMQKALQGMLDVKEKYSCPLVTDVHESAQVPVVSEVADVLQIPAFLCRQTDLLVEAAKSGKVVHIKKGQFMAPWDMRAIVEKVYQSGNKKVLLCDRGTSFGYNRLINDMTGLVEMRDIGCPVIFDATHSVQLPGATGSSSGGRREMIFPLARAAMAVGVDGLFIETHPDPDTALCDGPIATPLKSMRPMLQKLHRLWTSLWSPG